MDGMKETGIRGIGRIPSGWDMIKLRMGFSFSKGLSITKDDLVDDGIPVISYGQVHAKDNPGTGIVDSLLRYVPETFLARNKACLVQNGDFIFADTSEDYAGVGNAVFVDRDSTLFAGYHSIIARPTLSFMHPKYYAYLFQTNCWRDQIRANVMGVKVFSITQHLLRDTIILVPPTEEQIAITQYLDRECKKLDEIIDTIETQIETIKAYKKALITEIVTKGIIRNADMKDSGVIWIGKIPSHWSVSRLKYVIAMPLQYGANEAGDDYTDDYPRYIRITDITEDNELKDEGKLSLLPKVARPYLLSDGDVLFARSGATVGKTFYYKKECGEAAFAGYLIRAHADATIVLPKYLFYSTLGVGYENWKNMVFTQATIQNIGADKYAQLIITVPPIDEQASILEYLDAKCSVIDGIIEEKQKQSERMKQQKMSMIYELVTGKKSVKGVQQDAH